MKPRSIQASEYVVKPGFILGMIRLMSHDLKLFETRRLPMAGDFGRLSSTVHVPVILLSEFNAFKMSVAYHL